MYDQFDNELRSRIKHVFDNYEDNSADFGWEELRKRFPEKKDKNLLPMWIWRSAAASILFTIGAWIYQSRHSEKIYLVGKVHPEAVTSIDASSSSPVQAEAKVTQISPEAGETIISVEEVPQYSSNNTLSSASTQSNAGYREGQEAKKNRLSISAVVSDSPENTVTENLNTSLEESHTAPKQQINADTAVLAASLAEVQLNRPEQETIPAMNKVIENDKRRAKKAKQISIGIFAGSYFNYGEGSESSINTGLGVSSEVALTKKLKFSTGIALAKNTLKYDELIPSAVNADFRLATQINETEYLTGGFAAKIVPTYNLNTYNASLLGLDIPLNLKYTISEKRNQLYLLAGVSSNLFIDETYQYSYRVNSGTGISQIEQKDEKATSKFKSFDFAKMLNLSLGFGQPLGKQSRLSFEPFIKYPLAGQGTRDLLFGSAGMNLKLNFSTNKK